MKRLNGFTNTFQNYDSGGGRNLKRVLLLVCVVMTLFFVNLGRSQAQAITFTPGAVYWPQAAVPADAYAAADDAAYAWSVPASSYWTGGVTAGNIFVVMNATTTTNTANLTDQQIIENVIGGVMGTATSGLNALAHNGKGIDTLFIILMNQNTSKTTLNLNFQGSGHNNGAQSTANHVGTTAKPLHINSIKIIGVANNDLTYNTSTGELSTSITTTTTNVHDNITTINLELSDDMYIDVMNTEVLSTTTTSSTNTVRGSHIYNFTPNLATIRNLQLYNISLFGAGTTATATGKNANAFNVQPPNVQVTGNNNWALYIVDGITASHADSASTTTTTNIAGSENATIHFIDSVVSGGTTANQWHGTAPYTGNIVSDPAGTNKFRWIHTTNLRSLNISGLDSRPFYNATTTTTTINSSIPDFATSVVIDVPVHTETGINFGDIATIRGNLTVKNGWVKIASDLLSITANLTITPSETPGANPRLTIGTTGEADQLYVGGNLVQTGGEFNFGEYANFGSVKVTDGAFKPTTTTTTTTTTIDDEHGGNIAVGTSVIVSRGSFEVSVGDGTGTGTGNNLSTVDLRMENDNPADVQVPNITNASDIAFDLDRFSMLNWSAAYNITPGVNSHYGHDAMGGAATVTLRGFDAIKNDIMVRVGQLNLPGTGLLANELSIGASTGTNGNTQSLLPLADIVGTLTVKDMVEHLDEARFGSYPNLNVIFNPISSTGTNTSYSLSVYELGDLTVDLQTTNNAGSQSSLNLGSGWTGGVLQKVKNLTILNGYVFPSDIDELISNSNGVNLNDSANNFTLNIAGTLNINTDTYTSGDDELPRAGIDMRIVYDNNNVAIARGAGFIATNVQAINSSKVPQPNSELIWVVDNQDAAAAAAGNTTSDSYKWNIAGANIYVTQDANMSSLYADPDNYVTPQGNSIWATQFDQIIMGDTVSTANNHPITLTADDNLKIWNIVCMENYTGDLTLNNNDHNPVYTGETFGIFEDVLSDTDPKPVITYPSSCITATADVKVVKYIKITGYEFNDVFNPATPNVATDGTMELSFNYDLTAALGQSGWIPSNYTGNIQWQIIAIPYDASTMLQENVIALINNNSWSNYTGVVSHLLTVNNSVVTLTSGNGVLQGQRNNIKLEGLTDNTTYVVAILAVLPNGGVQESMVASPYNNITHDVLTDANADNTYCHITTPTTPKKPQYIVGTNDNSILVSTYNDGQDLYGAQTQVPNDVVDESALINNMFVNTAEDAIYPNGTIQDSNIYVANYDVNVLATPIFAEDIYDNTNILDAEGDPNFVYPDDEGIDVKYVKVNDIYELELTADNDDVEDIDNNGTALQGLSMNWYANGANLPPGFTFTFNAGAATTPSYANLRSTPFDLSVAGPVTITTPGVYFSQVQYKLIDGTWQDYNWDHSTPLPYNTDSVRVVAIFSKEYASDSLPDLFPYNDLVTGGGLHISWSNWETGGIPTQTTFDIDATSILTTTGAAGPAYNTYKTIPQGLTKSNVVTYSLAIKNDEGNANQGTGIFAVRVVENVINNSGSYSNPVIIPQVNNNWYVKWDDREVQPFAYAISAPKFYETAKYSSRLYILPVNSDNKLVTDVHNYTAAGFDQTGNTTNILANTTTAMIDNVVDASYSVQVFRRTNTDATKTGISAEPFDELGWMMIENSNFIPHLATTSYPLVPLDATMLANGDIEGTAKVFDTTRGYVYNFNNNFTPGYDYRVLITANYMEGVSTHEFTSFARKFEFTIPSIARGSMWVSDDNLEQNVIVANTDENTLIEPKSDLNIRFTPLNVIAPTYPNTDGFIGVNNLSLAPQTDDNGEIDTTLPFANNLNELTGWNMMNMFVGPVQYVISATYRNYETNALINSESKSFNFDLSDVLTANNETTLADLMQLFVTQKYLATGTAGVTINKSLDEDYVNHSAIHIKVDVDAMGFTVPTGKIKATFSATASTAIGVAQTYSLPEMILDEVPHFNITFKNDYTGMLPTYEELVANGMTEEEIATTYLMDHALPTYVNATTPTGHQVGYIYSANDVTVTLPTDAGNAGWQEVEAATPGNGPYYLTYSVNGGDPVELAGNDYKILGEDILGDIEVVAHYTPKEYELEADFDNTVSDDITMNVVNANDDVLYPVTAPAQSYVKFANDLTVTLTLPEDLPHFWKLTNIEVEVTSTNDPSSTTKILEDMLGTTGSFNTFASPYTFTIPGNLITGNITIKAGAVEKKGTLSMLVRGYDDYVTIPTSANALSVNGSTYVEDELTFNGATEVGPFYGIKAERNNSGANWRFTIPITPIPGILDLVFSYSEYIPNQGQPGVPAGVAIGEYYWNEIGHNTIASRTAWVTAMAGGLMHNINRVQSYGTNDWDTVDVTLLVQYEPTDSAKTITERMVITDPVIPGEHAIADFLTTDWGTTGYFPKTKYVKKGEIFHPTATINAEYATKYRLDNIVVEYINGVGNVVYTSTDETPIAVPNYAHYNTVRVTYTVKPIRHNVIVVDESFSTTDPLTILDSWFAFENNSTWPNPENWIGLFGDATDGFYILDGYSLELYGNTLSSTPIAFDNTKYEVYYGIAETESAIIETDFTNNTDDIHVIDAEDMTFTSADDNLYIIIKRIYAEYDVAISNVFKNTNGIVNTHHDLTTENVFKISDNNGGLTSISSGAPNNADYVFTLTQDATWTNGIYAKDDATHPIVVEYCISANVPAANATWITLTPDADDQYTIPMSAINNKVHIRVTSILRDYTVKITSNLDATVNPAFTLSNFPAELVVSTPITTPNIPAGTYTNGLNMTEADMFLADPPQGARITNISIGNYTSGWFTAPSVETSNTFTTPVTVTEKRYDETSSDPITKITIDGTDYYAATVANKTLANSGPGVHDWTINVEYETADYTLTTENIRMVPALTDETNYELTSTYPTHSGMTISSNDTTVSYLTDVVFTVSKADSGWTVNTVNYSVEGGLQNQELTPVIVTDPDDGSVTSRTYTIPGNTITGNVTVTVNQRPVLMAMYFIGTIIDTDSTVKNGKFENVVSGSHNVNGGTNANDVMSIFYTVIDNVTFTLTPDTGYELDKVELKKGSDNYALHISQDEETGIYTIKTHNGTDATANLAPGTLNVIATFKPISYTFALENTHTSEIEDLAYEVESDTSGTPTGTTVTESVTSTTFGTDIVFSLHETTKGWAIDNVTYTVVNPEDETDTISGPTTLELEEDVYTIDGTTIPGNVIVTINHIPAQQEITFTETINGTFDVTSISGVDPLVPGTEPTDAITGEYNITENIEFSVVPDFGYELDAVVVKYNNIALTDGDDTLSYDEETGVYTIVTTGESGVTNNNLEKSLEVSATFEPAAWDVTFNHIAFTPADADAETADAEAIQGITASGDDWTVSHKSNIVIFTLNEPEDGKHKIASVSYSIPATFDGTTTIAAVTNRVMTVDVDGNYTIPMDSTYNNITINVTYTNATYPLYFEVADGSPEVAGVTLSNLVNLDGLEQDEDGNYLLVYNPGTGIYGARLTATPANGVSFISTTPTIFADLDGDDVNDNSSESITNGGTWGANNVYNISIPQNAVAGPVHVVISYEAKTYNLTKTTEMYDTAPVTYLDDESKITFTDGVTNGASPTTTNGVTTGFATGALTFGTDVVFSIEPEAGKEVKTVQYKVGNGQLTDITPEVDASDAVTYTIAGANIVDNVEIEVVYENGIYDIAFIETVQGIVGEITDMAGITGYDPTDKRGVVENTVDVAFKITPPAGQMVKEVKYQIGSTTTTMTADADGYYTVDGDLLVDHININITYEAMLAISFNHTALNATLGLEYQGTIIPGAGVAFQPSAVSGANHGNGYIASGQDFKFTIAPYAGYRVLSVKYTVAGNTNPVTITPTITGSDTIYTIGSSIATSTNAPILVTVDYTPQIFPVTFVHTEDNNTFTGITSSIGSIVPIAGISNGNVVTYGANATFTITPAANKVVASVSYVKGSDAAVTITPINGVYQIDGDKILDEITVNIVYTPVYNITFVHNPSTLGASVTPVSGFYGNSNNQIGGADAVFAINSPTGYKVGNEIVVSIGGTTLNDALNWNDGTNEYTLTEDAITADVVITIQHEPVTYVLNFVDVNNTGIAEQYVSLNASGVTLGDPNEYSVVYGASMLSFAITPPAGYSYNTALTFDEVGGTANQTVATTGNNYLLPHVFNTWPYVINTDGTVNGDINVNVEWTADPYTIMFMNVPANIGGFSNITNVTNNMYTAAAAPTFEVDAVTGHNVAVTYTAGTASNVTINETAGIYTIPNTAFGNNISVMATYTPQTYTLTLNQSGAISSATNVTGITNGQTITYGQTYSFTVNPPTGYNVASVTVNGTAITAPYTFTATQNTTIAVAYTPQVYTVTVTQLPAGITGGSISSIGINSQITYGQTYSFTVTAPAGYDVSSVTLNGTALTAGTPQSGQLYNYTFTAQGNANIVVTYAPKTYTLTINQTPVIGTFQGVSNNMSITHGASYTFTIIPPAGYTVQTVSGGATLVGGNVYTIPAVAGNVTLSITYSAQSYLLTILENGATGGTFSGISQGQSVTYGQQYNFNITPPNCYSVANVTGATHVAGNTYSISVTGPTVVTVNYTQNTYGITINNGAISMISGSTTIACGTDAVFGIVPPTGSVIQNLSVTMGGQPASFTLSNGLYTIANVTGDIALFATYQAATYDIDFVHNSISGIVPGTGEIPLLGINNYANHHGTVTYNTLGVVAFQLNAIPAGYNLINVTYSVDGGTPQVISPSSTPGSTTPVYAFVGVTGDIEVSINYTYTTNYNIAITETPVSGTVNGITNGQTVGTNMQPTFTVTPPTGYIVTSVVANGTTLTAAPGTGLYTIPAVTANVNVAITYTLQTYTLTLTQNVQGATITGLPTNNQLSHGTAYPFTVTPPTGYIIESVTVDNVVITGPTYTIPAVTGNVAVNITYTPVPTYTLTLTETPVTGTVNGITDDQTITQGVAYPFTVTAPTGYNVGSVTVNGTAITAPYTFTAQGATTVAITYTAIPTYTLTLTETPVTGTVNGITDDQTITQGVAYPFTVTAPTGYNVGSVTVNGTAITAPYTFTAQGATTVAITYIPQTYTLTLTETPVTGTVNGITDDQTITQGVAYPFTVTAPTGYNVGSVTVNGTAITAPYTFTAQGATTVAITYTLKIGTIAFAPGLNTPVTPPTTFEVVDITTGITNKTFDNTIGTTDGTITFGTDVTFTLAPYAGHIISGVTYEIAGTGNPVTITGPNYAIPASAFIDAGDPQLASIYVDVNYVVIATPTITSINNDDNVATQYINGGGVGAPATANFTVTIENGTLNAGDLTVENATINTITLTNTTGNTRTYDVIVDIAAATGASAVNGTNIGITGAATGILFIPTANQNYNIRRDWLGTFTMSPANGTTNVPIAGTLTITFSEQLVGTGTVIAQLNGTALTMTTTNSTQFNAAYTGLTNNTNYNVYFSSFAGLTDKWGNAVTNPVPNNANTWAFTTVAPYIGVNLGSFAATTLTNPGSFNVTWTNVSGDGIIVYAVKWPTYTTPPTTTPTAPTVIPGFHTGNVITGQPNTFIALETVNQFSQAKTWVGLDRRSKYTVYGWAINSVTGEIGTQMWSYDVQTRKEVGFDNSTEGTFGISAINPQPAQYNANFNVIADEEGALNVSIHDMSGAQVQNAVISRYVHANETVQVNLDLHDIASGVYNVIVTVGNDRAIRSLVIKK